MNNNWRQISELTITLYYRNNVMVVVVYLASYLEELHTQTQCLPQGNASVKTHLDTKVKEMRTFFDTQLFYFEGLHPSEVDGTWNSVWKYWRTLSIQWCVCINALRL